MIQLASVSNLRALAVTAVLATGFGAALPTLLHGSDQVQHYAGLEAATLEEAVTNFAEYNTRLAELLEQAEIGPRDLETVHELTYTLENALAKMQEELTGLAGTLEAVHLASEARDVEVVRAEGEAFLETARTLVP